MLTLPIEGAPERLTLGCQGDDLPLPGTWISLHQVAISAPIICTLTMPRDLDMTGRVGLHALIAVTTLTAVAEVTYLFM